MLREEKTIEKKKLSIPVIQKYLFYLILFLAPLSIIPFPWDWTERGIGLLVLFLGTIIITLEVVKLVWEGKLTLLKGTLDGGIMLVFLSLIFSTLFSKDLSSSIWGMDGKLGTGIIAFVCILLVSLSARTFIKTAKEIKVALLAFVIGFSITNILSILSFLGINIWGFIPVYKDLAQDGLPLLRSAKSHLFVNFILMLINLGLLSDYIIDKAGKNTILVITIISVILSAINIWIFSINQGIGLIILFVLLSIAMWIFGIRRLKITPIVTKNILFALIGILLGILVPTIILQIPSLREVIIPDSINVVAQVSLGSDVSWIIAASVFVSSFVRGLFGMGMDTYPIAYNLYKPLSQNLLQYNDVNFYYGASELFTQFTNNGLLWLIAWGVFGFLIIKIIKRDLGRVKVYKEEVGKSLMLISLDLLILYIYLGSFFAIYGVLVLLLLLAFITLRCILLDILSKNTEEKFVIKLWTANLRPEGENGKMSYNLNIFFTVLVGCVGLGLLILWGSKFVASAYLLKAESYYVEQNQKYADVEPTMEQRKVFVNSMTYYYVTAAKFDGNNPLINRKAGSMYLELVGLAAEEYSKSGTTEEGNADLITSVGKWKNYALDYTRKSVDISGSVYANWDARASIYLGLVGMGFNDYASDALYSLEKTSELNPLNYATYYNEAQIYVVNGDKDSALAALTKALGINAQHIPSIMLAAEINKQKGNTDVYESYLKAAKKILETNSQTGTEVYQTIVEELNKITTN